MEGWQFNRKAHLDAENKTGQREVGGVPGPWGSLEAEEGAEGLQGAFMLLVPTMSVCSMGGSPELSYSEFPHNYCSKKSISLVINFSPSSST